jgi:hypothetical protein
METHPQDDPQPDRDDTPGKKPRGKPFTGRDDPRNGHLVQAARAAQEEPVEPEDVSLYEAMRHVFSQPKEADRTQPQRECRAWLKDDRKGFLSKMADLEKAALARPPSRKDEPGGEESPPAEDAGTARALALCDQQLAQAGARRAEENAELAARPGAAALGASLQRQLREALWEERQLREKAPAPEGADPVLEFFDRFEAGARREAAELAIHACPAEVIASLRGELDYTLQRLGNLRRAAEPVGQGPS